jgi:hypothetical protein
MILVQDKTRQDKAKEAQDKARSKDAIKTRQGKVRHDKIRPKQHKTRQDQNFNTKTRQGNKTRQAKIRIFLEYS